MNARSLIILAILIIISFGSIWFASRKPAAPSVEQPIDTLIIGTNAEYPPFSVIENDQIVGFDIDVVQQVATRLNKKFIFKNMSFEALVPELQLGTIHVIAAGISPTEERAQRVFFTQAHFDGDPLVAVQKEGSEPIAKGSQLIGKTVVVNQGYTADQYVTDLGNIEIVRLSSALISMGLMALDSDQADVFVTSKSSLRPFLEKRKTNLVITPIEGTSESSALAVSKKYPNLFASIQTVISDMRNDGTIEALKKKWKLYD